MKDVVFILNEETNGWQYKDLTLTVLKKTHQWELMTGTKSIFFDSIYDVLSKLSQKGYHATFRSPPSMDNVSSSCNS